MNGTQEQVKATAGPWQVDRFNTVRTNTYGALAGVDESLSVSRLWQDDHGETHTDEICEIVMDYRNGIPEANANLIAAAPELYAACRKAIPEIRHLFAQCTGEVEAAPLSGVGRTLAALLAAIAKAEGRPL